MPKKVNILGQRFGALVIRKRVGTARGRMWWDCFCDCGKSIFADTGRLVSGNTKSCGCAQKNAAAKTCRDRSTHFMSGTRLWNIYRSMHQRVECPNNINYHRYGGRGISICKDWAKFPGFMKWAMANGYSEKLSIDRVDNDGNYEPSNCRWATQNQQQNNKSSSIIVEFNGEKKSVSEWALIVGIKYSTLANRIKAGWPTDKAFGLPVDHRNRIA